MRAYCRLLGQAVESITATFQQKLADHLQGSRSFVLPAADEQPQESDSAFELVTWLVLLDGTAAQG